MKKENCGSYEFEPEEGIDLCDNCESGPCMKRMFLKDTDDLDLEMKDAAAAKESLRIISGRQGTDLLNYLINRYARLLSYLIKQKDVTV